MSAPPGLSSIVTSVEQLEKIYGVPYDTSVAKEIDHISVHYAKLIEVAPFVVIATSGKGGLDCSPRGDAPGFVRMVDNKTLMIPDRPGNKRVDSFHNLMEDPRISLLFIIPGIGETLRVNGSAALSVDPALCESFAVGGRPALSVLVVTVESVYFHCSKALTRSKLWDPSSQIPRGSLPTTGTMMADITGGKMGGAEYDRNAVEFNRKTLY